MSADFVIESFEPAAEYLKYVDQRVTYWNGKQLAKEAENWKRLSAAISHVVQLEEA